MNYLSIESEELISDEKIEQIKNSLASGEKEFVYYSIEDTLVVGVRREDEITIFVTQKYKVTTFFKDDQGEWKND